MIKCKKILLALGIGIFGCSVLQAQSGLLEKIGLKVSKSKEEQNAACKKEIGVLIGNSKLLDNVDPHNKRNGSSFDEGLPPYCAFLKTLKKDSGKENNIIRGCYYGIDVHYDRMYDEKGRLLQYTRMCTSVPSIVKVGKKDYYIDMWNINNQSETYHTYDKYSKKAVFLGCQNKPVECPGKWNGKYYPERSVVVTDTGKKVLFERKKNEIRKFFTTSASPKVVERVLKLVKDYTTEVQMCFKNANVRSTVGVCYYHDSFVPNGALHVKSDNKVYDRDGNVIDSAEKGVIDGRCADEDFPDPEDAVVRKNWESFIVECK